MRGVDTIFLCASMWWRGSGNHFSSNNGILGSLFIRIRMSSRENMVLRFNIAFVVPFSSERPLRGRCLDGNVGNFKKAGMPETVPEKA